MSQQKTAPMAPIYFDYAAATPLDPAVISAMEPYFSDKFFNPSAGYLSAKAVAADLSAARQTVAHWLGAKPSEIVFTAGGTEANNLAAYGVMNQYPDGNIVISAIEHPSVVEAADMYSVREVKVATAGQVDLDDLAAKIDDKTGLVSIIYANNEIGTVQSLSRIATVLQKIRDERRAAGNDRPLYLHTDACQAANYLDLHAARLGVDLMTLNGGKIYGPKQSGVLFVRSGIVLTPLIRGGGQERGLRSGTENVAGAVGFAEALDIAQAMRKEESKRLAALQKYLSEQLTARLPEAKINGSIKHRLPNNLSITFPGADNERLMMQLDEAGIIVAVGSACSASKDEPSHTLKAIGMSDQEARATLRISLGRGTTKAQIDKLLKVLQGLVSDE